MEVTVKVDQRADAAYISLVPIGPGEARYQHPCVGLPEVVRGEVILDFDREGHLLGIEVLDAEAVLPPKVYLAGLPLRPH